MTLSPHQRFKGQAERSDRQEALEPITVDEIFRRHIRLLSSLPGEISQFDQSEFGYEWRCECGIGNALQLHFSLIDLERQKRPVAVLYLVGTGKEHSTQDRLLLPLEDLSETQEQLNRQLTHSGTATIEVLEKANHFILELAKVKESLGNEATWG
jgi:hypothetical protein